VFSTHVMQEVSRLADRVVLVAHGRTLAEGTVDELCALAGESDFEEAFVKLAFTPEERGTERVGPVQNVERGGVR
jgi:sodium transport system ATP-binding protein